MNITTKISKMPKIAWQNLNTGLIHLAVAGDAVAVVKKRIAGGRVTPPLKPATIARKKKHKTIPLMHTERLHNSIRSHLTPDKKGAEVYIEDSDYPASKNQEHVVTTNEMAVLHTKGMGNLPVRKFFYCEEADADVFYERRIKQGLDNELKRIGFIK